MDITPSIWQGAVSVLGVCSPAELATIGRLPCKESHVGDLELWDFCFEGRKATRSRYEFSKDTQG